MIPEAKLSRLVDRFHAVEAELASGTAGNAFVKLSKEHAELAPVIAVIESYRAAERQLKDADAIIADPAMDAEMRGLAEDEREDAKTRLVSLEQAVKIQLLPKDAAD